MWWRTWIKIDCDDQMKPKAFQDTIRQKLYPILQLQRAGEIDWFYFLFHPKPEDPINLYYDVVLTTDKKNPKEFLPSYCIDTTKITPLTSISGIDESLLKYKDIGEAWKLIGDQSVFIINLVCSHSEEGEISSKQFVQFMHFFMNSMGWGFKSYFIDYHGKRFF